MLTRIMLIALICFSSSINAIQLTQAETLDDIKDEVTLIKFVEEFKMSVKEVKTCADLQEIYKVAKELGLEPVNIADLVHILTPVMLDNLQEKASHVLAEGKQPDMSTYVGEELQAIRKIYNLVLKCDSTYQQALNS